MTEIKVRISRSDLWVHFIKTLSVTGHCWLVYVEMVMILKRYIHAERAGLWKQHLTEVENMLPFMVSAHHTRYMSCIPLYLKDMKALSTEHPEVHERFMNGDFTVHCSEGRYNGVWSDMALEQTYNKEGKTTLFKGISQTPAAREKYVKSVPFLASISQNVKSMTKVFTK